MHPCKQLASLFMLLSTILISYGDCAKILGVFHVPGRSHYIVEGALMKGLADAGHDVTMVNAVGGNHTVRTGSNGRYREVVLTGLLKEMEGQSKILWEMSDANPFIGPIFFAKIGTGIAEQALSHPNFQSLIHSDEKFDVVIVGQLMGDVFKALAKHYDAHLIVFNSIGSNTWVNDFVGNPALPSYLPEPVFNFPDKMNFWQRVQNTLYKAIFNTVLNLYYYPRNQKLVDAYIPRGGNLADSLYNSSLILLNGHESLSYPQNMAPSMINIGGFHLKPAKKLPDELQEFMDKSKDGVIYFSMGSNLKSKDLPTQKRDMILRAFGKLRQNVLWKWEDDKLPGKPPNVRLGKWLPQPDILAHPNTKIFITHGGIASTMETVYHGVPIIAIPIFGDQKSNAKFAVTSGYGRLLPYGEVTEEALAENIQEILKNSPYSENVRRRSALMKDRQVGPLQNAIYWIEYVIRQNGAKHLRLSTLDLAWYQVYLLDVLGCLALVVVSAVLILKMLWSWLCCRRKSAENPKPKSE